LQFFFQNLSLLTYIPLDIKQVISEGRWYLYSAFKHARTLEKRSGMDHTVLPANKTMPAFPFRKRSPDGATTTEAADIQLQLTTHLSTPSPNRMKG